MRHHLIALRSAYKAFMKQYRKRLTELRRDEPASVVLDKLDRL